MRWTVIKRIALVLVVFSFLVSEANAALIPNRGKMQYETVAASQTDQVAGGTGGVGDVLQRLLIVPATTGAGEVLIQDGDGTAISVFKGGTTVIEPRVLELGIRSVTGAWSITTGANVSAVAIGEFTT